MSYRILSRFMQYLFGGLILLTFISYGERETAPAQTGEKNSKHLPQVIHSVSMTNSMDFAGEQVPLERPDVEERLEQELTINSYWHSSTLLNLKRAHRYFPVIEQILREEGVPEDFKYLAVAESNLENVTSPAGAKGVWQFMPRTARAYDLEISGDVEERYHIEKATRAACKYLKDYKEDFGSWTLAATAYNMGGPRLKRAISKQKEHSYYDLNLNAETSRYIFRILAFKQVLEHPEHYGFYLEEHEHYDILDDYRKVKVDTSISNLGHFAHQFDVSYRMLKRYNPWLISHQLNNYDGKTYAIRIPNSAG